MALRQGPYRYDFEDDHGYRGKGPWVVVVLRQGPYSYGIGSKSGDALKWELLSDRDVSYSFPPAKLRKSGKTHKVQRKKCILHHSLIAYFLLILSMHLLIISLLLWLLSMLFICLLPVLLIVNFICMYCNVMIYVIFILNCPRQTLGSTAPTEIQFSWWFFFSAFRWCASWSF